MSLAERDAVARKAIFDEMEQIIGREFADLSIALYAGLKLHH